MNCLKKEYLDRVKHIIFIIIFISFIFNRIKLFLKDSKSFMLLTLKYKLFLQKDKLIKLLGSYPIYKGSNPFSF